jgi:guanylate cyclase 2F
MCVVDQGEIVHLKPITQMTATDSSNTIRAKTSRYLLKLYALKHENLTKFMAIYDTNCELSHKFVFVWEFCSRGSLRDVITNTDIKLDWNFKVSLMGDLIRVEAHLVTLL